MTKRIEAVLTIIDAAIKAVFDRDFMALTRTLTHAEETGGTPRVEWIS